MGEARPGARWSISGDTAPCEMTRVAAHEAQLLVHDSSFADEEVERAARDRALDGRQAAELAAEAGVDMLALVHISSRYDVARGARRGARGVPRGDRAARLRPRRDPVPRARRAAPDRERRPRAREPHATEPSPARDPRRAPRPPPARRVASPPRPAPRARAARPLSGVDDRRPARGRLRGRRHASRSSPSTATSGSAR